MVHPYLASSSRAVRGLVLVVACLFGLAVRANPVHVEFGDAGETIAAAQDTVGSGALSAIQGVLEGDADVFRIFVDGGQTFSASTALSGIAFNNFDMSLFLFNEAGLGVYANDDDALAGPYSVLPPGNALTPLLPGYYYLAIAGAGYLPQSVFGSIFPTANGLLDGTSDVLGPGGPGGHAVLTNWSGVSGQTGAYEIVLTGAQFAVVPEPASLALVLLALAAAGGSALRRGARRLVLGLGTLVLAGAVHAQYARLDAALSDVVDVVESGDPAAPWSGVAAIHQDDGQLDPSGSLLLVDAYLDDSGSVTVSQFQAMLESLGALVVAVDPEYGNGALAAYVPISRLRSASMLPGLHVMSMALRPESRAARVISQGVKVLRSDIVNREGYTGRGITVGVISDSFDRNLLARTQAQDDYDNDELKRLKARAKEYVLSNGDWTDEGRAMLQIVHDVAPEADLCFASGAGSELHLSAAMAWLREGDCAADVIVDDQGYADAPVFSDGPAARQVDRIVGSSTATLKPVVYFSAAGNESGTARKGSIDLPQARFQALPPPLAATVNVAACKKFVPSTGHSANDTGGGWLVFRTDAAGNNPVFSEDIEVNSNGMLVLQWDDPFRARAMTADLNVYVFNATGECVLALATNNHTEDRAVELIRLRLPWLSPGGGAFQGRIMVARTSVGTRAAMDVRIGLRLSYFKGAITSAALNRVDSPTVFGHPAAARAIAVSAYRYSKLPALQPPYTPELEAFSSVGPVRIAFDARNRRLPVAETRKKPDLAAPDRVDNTFFPRNPAGLPCPPNNLDYECNGLPNFTGTSAAAPHAAAVAALMLQKAGGPRSLSPAQVKTILQSTTPARLVPYGNSNVPSRVWSVYDGFGLIDAVNAMSRVPRQP